MQWTSRLAHLDLQAIIDGLERGSLRSPFTEAGCFRLFGRETGKVVHQGLKQLNSFGFNDHQISVALALVREDRVNSRINENLDRIDLVWTGPETMGITNRDTKVVVQELFRHAKRNVLISGFAVYQGKDIFKTLAEKMDGDPDFSVDMFLNIHRQRGDTTRREDLVKRFIAEFKQKQWIGTRLPCVYFDPRSLALDQKKGSVLHAKCVVTDKTASFVTSANFTEAAQERNIEVGVLIKIPLFSEKLHDHFVALSSSGLLERII
ncbi:DISARM system phospholipase D-like protein DrmC [Oligoflexus tunisiensis]|uniref:DISARM system phospholipase D-like protein DrmC n=1 Tax=Oligoflexus tunisiensis TaxID=708132 RepID=UPI000B2CEB2A|nr:DISARM system phospholipase D-like protein DrmC [Oligoflexus tunisiensis]